VKGFVLRRPSWITQTLRPGRVREEAALMEIESRRFYKAASQRTSVMPAFDNFSVISPRKSNGTKPPPRKSRMNRPNPAP